MVCCNFSTNGTHIPQSRDYATAGLLPSFQDFEGTNAISSISYGYNSGGNRTNRVENGIADTYTYDAIDQITGVSYSTNRTVSYGYDSLGSRTNVTDNSVPTAYTANNLNQYTAVGGASLAYDAKGNLTTGPGSASYAYDGNNRLTSATVGTNSATFTHDARMRNVKRVVDGQTRYFYFDDWSLVQERDGSGNVIQNYVNGPRIDEIIRKTDSSGTVYYHADALGSVVALTDHIGDVVERYTYDVFGTPTVFDSSLTILTSSLQNNRFLFTGREWIGELGLYDYRNRIYSPTLGRFLQTDPIRFSAGDANLYRYVLNGPGLWRDPLGLYPTSLTTPQGIAGLVEAIRNGTMTAEMLRELGLTAGLINAILEAAKDEKTDPICKFSNFVDTSLVPQSCGGICNYKCSDGTSGTIGAAKKEDCKELVRKSDLGDVIDF